ncbi:MAG: DUF58 domain-containing protein [Oligosphaeraceae bacterium]
MPIPPEILKRLGECRILAPRLMEGLPLAGIQRSRRPGEGLEFHHYRPYMAGDSLRHLDWRLYGRGGGLSVRVQTPDAPGRFALLLDASASMGYQGVHSSCGKLAYASLLAACLGWVASRQGEQLGLFAYRRTLLEESGERLSFEMLCARLDALEGKAAETGAPDAALQACGDFLAGRGVALWLSDFLEEEEQLAFRLRSLRSACSGVYAIQVLDWDEVHLPFQEVRLFRDPERRRMEVEALAPLARKEYQQRLREHQARIQTIFQQEEIPLLSLTTREDPGTALAAFLATRKGDPPPSLRAR